MIPTIKKIDLVNDKDKLNLNLPNVHIHINKDSSNIPSNNIHQSVNINISCSNSKTINGDKKLSRNNKNQRSNATSINSGLKSTHSNKNNTINKVKNSLIPSKIKHPKNLIFNHYKYIDPYNTNKFNSNNNSKEKNIIHLKPSFKNHPITSRNEHDNITNIIKNIIHKPNIKK